MQTVMQTVMPAICPAQIFIVEGKPAVRRDYTLLLQREPGLEVCGAVASGEEALTLIPCRQPDLVIVNMMLTGMNSLILSEQLYQTQPALPILVVFSHERMVYTMHKSPARVANVKGYLHKLALPQIFVATIHKVLSTNEKIKQSVKREVLEQ